MKSLINKFTNKYTCFYNLFNVRELETKDHYFTRGIETVKNHCRHSMEKSFVRNIKYHSQRSVWSIFSLERQLNKHKVET